MAGCVVYRWVHLGEISVRWLRCGLVSVAAVGMAMAVGLPIAAHYFLPGEEWLGLVGLIPLAGSGACWLLVDRRQHMGAAVSLAGMAIAFSVMLMAGVAVTVSGHQPYDRLLRAFAGRADAPVVAFGNLEPSWVFYARRPIRFYHDGQTDALRQFLLTKTGGFVITTSERLERLRPTILKDVAVLAECPYFLRDKTLMVLGSRGGTRELADSASTSPPDRLR
jgi:hypothetical protein